MTATNAAAPTLVTGARARILGARSGAAHAGIAVLAATLVWHLSNFLFNSVSARLLGPSGYSELAATMAVLYVASPALLSVQTMTSRTFTLLVAAGGRRAAGGYLRRTLRKLAFVAGAIAVLAFLVGDAGGRLLNVDSDHAVSIAVVGLSISLLTHCQRGALQGGDLLGRFALSTATEAVTKVVGAAVLLVVAGRTVDAAVAAVPLAALCTLIVNSFLVRPFAGTPTGAHAPAIPPRRPAATLLTFVGLAVLLSADVVVAKQFLPSYDAGVYAAVSLCGKTVFFATSAASTILFPRFSAGASRRLLAAGLGIVAGASTVVSLLYFVAPDVIVRPLLGSAFDAAAPYVGWIGVAFGCYGVLYLSALYMLARGRRAGAGAIVVATLLQTSSLALIHGSIGAIVAVQVFVLAAAAAGVAALALTTTGDEE
jgi:O-antigen/teichoic acid export membrane protein